MALLDASTELCINFCGHFPSQHKQFLVASQPVEFANTFNFEGMALVINLFATLYLVAALGRVLLSATHNFEYDRVTLKACVICLIVGYTQLSSVLQNAHSIAITCVLITSPNLPMSNCLILATDKGFMDSYFDKFLRVVSEVRQRRQWPIEELW